MTLIDAKKLIRAILDFPDCENGYSDTYDKEFIISEIEAQPTVDAVPVVRCRHCKYYKCGDCTHEFWGVAENDYCSDGERKEE